MELEQKYIDLNNEVNKLLRSGLDLAMILERQEQKELAREVLAITSKLACMQLDNTGLRDALREFWNDKVSMATNIN